MSIYKKYINDEKILLKPIIYSIIINDEESCNKIRNCNYKASEYNRYVEKISGSSELKFRYILGLCQSLKSKRRKFVLHNEYSDIFNKCDEKSVYTREDYVKRLLEMNINTIEISSEMSSEQKKIVHNKISEGKVDGIIVGSSINTNTVTPYIATHIDCIITSNPITSAIKFNKLVDIGMFVLQPIHLYKKCCYVYEILLDTQKEVNYSKKNNKQLFKKEILFVSYDGHLYGRQNE